MGWLWTFWLINKISFRSIWLRKSAWFGTLIFAGCLLILLPFAFGIGVLKRPDVSLGSLWIVHEFVVALSISRLFVPETESQALDFLLSSRSSRSALFLGKVSFATIEMFSLQIPITLLWVILYHVPEAQFISWLDRLSMICLFFDIGSCALGALIFCLTIRTLAKDILQPILFFPLQSSLLLAAVSLSVGFFSDHLIGAFDSSAWWTILLSYPVLLITLGCLLSSILFQE